METGQWLDCQFLRYIGRQECVIRLVSTGAIIQIKLRDPLDVTRACILSALKPANGRVLLGRADDGQPFNQDCVVDVDWPSKLTNSPPMPPPARFERTLPRRPLKRKKVFKE